MSTFSFPDGYGLVFGGIFATCAANLYCVINVARHRKRFGIQYPTLCVPQPRVSYVSQF